MVDTSSTSSSNLLQPASLPDETATGNAYLTAGEVVCLRAEYIHHGGATGAGVRTKAVRVVLGWESAGTPAQLIPPFALYPGGEEIVGSPFGFSID